MSERREERIDLSPEPASVAAARRWIVDAAQRVGCESAADTLALLVSELVGNVVLHARTTCDVRFSASDDMLRVEVRDHSTRVPVAISAVDPSATSGRGMLLVHRLSSAHGSEPGPEGGKVVWFELERQPPTVP